MKKTILLICGWLLLVVGAIGIVLPVLPTTPFVLLAAMCFSASSERLYQWLLKNRFFGPYIENYRTGQGVSKQAKIRGIFILWLLLVISAVAMQKVWSSVMFALVGISVTIHLCLIKTKE